MLAPPYLRAARTVQKNRTLYLTEDTLGQLTAGKYPFISAGSSMTEEIRNLVNSRVESIIADD